ncbi:MAG: type I restriction enzyme HsdR N-terminal domain-containing protein [Deltaproteobacteria bacterium]|nr:type I restriction enzyme HsdR N-terminal domain-containing protein [Deltaproteobacteria bacterium]
MSLSKRITERIVQQVKRYQGILADAKNRDISESDTVMIIANMLADVLGYKKFIEITTEYSIRGTYVDLAVKVGNEVRFLVEAKAIGSPLKDAHVKQAIDYGANQGIEWIILSNGAIWQVYKIHFKQPIEKTLIYEVDLLNINPKNQQLIECFGNLSREGFTQSSMAAFCQQKQITSKFSIAAILMSPPMLMALRREIRRITPGVKVDEELLKTTLQYDVLKREVVDSDDAKQVSELFKKASRCITKAKAKDMSEPKKAAIIPLPPMVPPPVEKSLENLSEVPGEGGKPPNSHLAK